MSDGYVAGAGKPETVAKRAELARRLERSRRRGRSRCDSCGRRIGPARYELGLCAGCELVSDFIGAELALAAVLALLSDPTFVERIERQSKALADAMKAATG